MDLHKSLAGVGVELSQCPSGHFLTVCLNFSLNSVPCTQALRSPEDPSFPGMVTSLMPAEMGGEGRCGCVPHLGIFHQNTSPAGLSNGPSTGGVDSGLHVLLLLAFPKIRLATVPEPHHPSSSPLRQQNMSGGWTPKISRQVWDEVSPEPAGRGKTSPDMARVTSL